MPSATANSKQARHEHPTTSLAAVDMEDGQETATKENSSAKAKTLKFNVFVRIAPFKKALTSTGRAKEQLPCVEGDPKACTVTYDFTPDNTGVTGAKRKNETFVFDQVFLPSDTQETVYENSCRPIVQHIVQGGKGAVLMYGPSGSGKTHSLLGTVYKPGCVTLFGRDLFLTLDASKLRNPNMSDICVRISIMELSHGKAKDLLADAGIGDWSRPKLVMREDDSGGLSVENLTAWRCYNNSDLQEALSKGYGAALLMRQGRRGSNRSASSNVLSHIVTTIRVSFARSSANRLSGEPTSGSPMPNKETLNLETKVSGNLDFSESLGGNNSPFRVHSHSPESKDSEGLDSVGILQQGGRPLPPIKGKLKRRPSVTARNGTVNDFPQLPSEVRDAYRTTGAGGQDKAMGNGGGQLAFQNFKTFDISNFSDPDSNGEVAGLVHFVDLAAPIREGADGSGQGMELLAPGNDSGKAVIERAQVNKAISTLGTVLSGLADGRHHVPFRDSKLTRLLKSGIDPPSMCSIITHLRENDNPDAVWNSLKFTTRLKKPSPMKRKKRNVPVSAVVLQHHQLKEKVQDYQSAMQRCTCAAVASMDLDEDARWLNDMETFESILDFNLVDDEGVPLLESQDSAGGSVLSLKSAIARRTGSKNSTGGFNRLKENDEEDRDNLSPQTMDQNSNKCCCIVM